MDALQKSPSFLSSNVDAGIANFTCSLGLFGSSQQMVSQYDLLI